MGSNGADEIYKGNGVEGSEATIEIKIKTMDFQTYTLRVNKQMSVPALKEQIASVTGVLSEQQRLICRGRVLKDDQLLSAYHVEDGHTLHLVIRQIVPSFSESSPSHPAPDPFSSQVAPGGVHPDINRMVSSVLGAFGINDTGSGTEGVDVQVIPDSLTTLSQYLSLMRQEYAANGNNGHDASVLGIQGRQYIYTSPSPPVQERIPTPELLAEVLLSTSELLIGQTAECFLQLRSELHNQSNVTDPIERLSTQSNAWRSGTLFQNLGAFLLELGRTTMTLQMGQTASEAVVNAGPAVFISQFGPNPMMPISFQPRTSFGVIPTSTGQTGSGLINDTGAGLLPRLVDIQIPRGSSTDIPNVNPEEHASSQQPSGLGNLGLSSGGATHVDHVTSAASEGLSHTAESGVQQVPLRTMVDAVPGLLDRLSHPGIYQHVASAHLIDRGLHVFGEHHPSGFQTEPQPVPESGVQQNTRNRARDGNSTNASVELGSLQPLRFRFGVLSTGITDNHQPSEESTDETENHQPSESEVPSEVFEFLRSLFRVDEIHVEDPGLQGTTPSTVSGNTGTTSTAADAQEAEPRVSDDGVSLSNLLRQTMPLTSQLTGAAQGFIPTETSTASGQITAHESSIEEAEPQVSDDGVFLSNLLRQIMPLISQLTGAAPGFIPTETPTASELTTAHESSFEME